MVFDNDGADKVMFVELKPFADWDGVDQGQRRLYEHLVRIGRGKIFAVIAQPESSDSRTSASDTTVDMLVDKRIDTTRMVAFQVMHWHKNRGGIVLDDVQDGSLWASTVIKLMEYQ